MKVIKYNKLIRDSIPEIIKKSGAIPKILILDNSRFLKELKKKLIEEASELEKAINKKSLLNELVDVLEILLTIARIEKISWGLIKTKRQQKNRERGGFKKKLFLKEVWELKNCKK